MLHTKQIILSIFVLLTTALSAFARENVENMDNFTYAVVKNIPEKIAELHETRNSVECQRNMVAKYWIQLNFGGDVSDSVIDEVALHLK